MMLLTDDLAALQSHHVCVKSRFI